MGPQINAFKSMVFGFLLCMALASHAVSGATEEEAIAYLEALDLRFSAACNIEKQARWDYVTNITTETQANSVAATKEFENFKGIVQDEILVDFSNFKEFSNTTKRAFQYLSILGPALMPQEDVDAMNLVKANLDSAYASTTICEYNNPENCELKLAAVDGKLNTVEDFDELDYYWSSWHNSISNNLNASDYAAYISYQNTMSQHNGFSDISDMGLAGFNPGTTEDWSATEFKTEMQGLWAGLQPYYNQLQAFIRMKLRSNPNYADKIEKTGSIPANLVKGWTLSKNDLSGFYKQTKPFPDSTSVMEAGTEALIEAGYTVKQIFEDSDNFYDSLGLQRMTSSFWEKSFLENPNDGRVVDCNPPFEWDMCLGKGNEDFRIKVCGEVNMNYVSIIHHEMGHMEYFMEYRNEQYIFRDGATPGFHEGIGNAMPLAITTPHHMGCILGLDLGFETNCLHEGKKKQADATPEDINFLYSLALEKFGFFANTIALESWRWEVVEGLLTEANYNSRWWEIKRRFQGISPPSARPGSGFDAATKVISTAPNYIRYYTSYILQFQFYESMCKMAGEWDEETRVPALHLCDFTGSLEAGTKLKEMLQVGFSDSWPKVLEKFTGRTEVSIEPLLNYFQPLFTYISEELEAAGELPCFDEWC